MSTTNTPKLTASERTTRRVESLIYKNKQSKVKQKAVVRMKAAPARFNNLFEFVEQHNTVDKCMAYLESIRFKDGKYCPHCGMFDNKATDTPYMYYCNSCEDTFTVKTGTIFNDVEARLPHWLTAAYLENSFIGGVTGSEVAKQLPYCRKIGSYMTQQIRRYGHNQNCFEDFVITDNDKEVYVLDTTVVDGVDSGRHDHRKGSYQGGINRFIVLVIIQKNGNARAYIVDSVERDSVLPYILKQVPKGCSIYTDEHSSFDILESCGYDHEKVNHSAKQFGRNEISTNLVEGFNAHFKTGFAKYRNSIPRLHAQLFVDAAIFRYNTRYMSESEKLDLVVSNVFTKFKEQAQPIEDYKTKAIDYRKAEHNRRREIRQAKDLEKRNRNEGRVKRTVKKAVIQQRRDDKKAIRESKAAAIQQRRDNKKAVREGKQAAAQQRREAKKAVREGKQAAAQQRRDDKKAARQAKQATTTSKASKQAKQAKQSKATTTSKAKQGINVRVTKQPATRQASKQRKATAKR